MDAEILFTVLSQQKDEIICKKLKREQIAPELVKAYLKFKAEKDEKIIKQNARESESLPVNKPEEAFPSKPKRGCWEILCCCFSPGSNEERQKEKRENEKIVS